MRECENCSSSIDHKRKSARYCNNICSLAANPKPQNQKQFIITLELLEEADRETLYGQSRLQYVADKLGCDPSLVGLRAKELGFVWPKRPREKLYTKTTNVERKYAYSIGCVICKENRVVDAAHIYPARLGGSGQVENIVPLCPTHHRLYDYGRMTDEEYDIMADFIIKENKDMVWPKNKQSTLALRERKRK